MRGGRAELVGRDTELGVLTASLAAAASGDPRIVLCRGEPGIGKTRLAEELVALAAARGIPAVWGRCAESEGAPPYWPWRQVLAALAARSAGGSDFAPLLPGGVGAGADGGAEERFRIFDAAASYLRALTAESPLVIVLDDLHWADQPSLLLLGHVARGLGDGRLMIVVTYRDTELATDHPLAPLLVELTRQRRVERLDLGGLPVADVGRQLAAVTGTDVAAPTVHRVYELTAGNPFFVAELGRTLTEGTAGSPVPASVREAIAARLDRLPEPCRRLLHAGSIAGREFPVRVIAAIADRPVLDCLQPIDDATAAGLIEPSGTVGEYRFAHALVRDAVEAGLPTADRVRLHRAAAMAIEACYPGRLEPHLSDLARHWAASAVLGEQDVAARWAQRAGDEAMRRLAFEEGARLYRQAVAVGADEWGDEDRFRLLRALAEALHRSADLAAALEVALQAAEVARRLERPDLVGEVALILEPSGYAPWDRAAHELSAEALAGPPEGPAPRRVHLLSRLAESGFYLLELTEAERLSAEALVLAERSNDPTALVAALRARQLTRSGPDGLAERARLVERMLRTGREQRDPVAQMWGHLWRIDTCLETGDLAAVSVELGPLEACVDRVRGPIARWHLLKTRATLAQAQARFTDALRLSDEAAATLAMIGHPAASPSRFALLGAVGRHVGFEASGALGLVPSFRAAELVKLFTIFDAVGPVVMLVEAGQQAEAARRYREAGPVRGWTAAPSFEVVLYALGVGAAIAMDAKQDAAELFDLLARHRGRHAVAGGGSATYNGPVELHLGAAAAYLGRYDEAVADLEEAASICDGNGAVGFAAEARFELAAALAGRRGSGDLPRAHQLLTAARRQTVALGMDRITGLIDGLSASLDAERTASPLTARENEVAGFVARGMTNREIAASLVLSERTVETHVQHILAKLGFANRSQIAAWVAGHASAAAP